MEALAQNPNTPTDVLSELAELPGCYYLHYLVALNPNTADDILFKLAGSRTPQVKSAVADNLNASAKTLSKLMNSKVNDRDFWESLLLTIINRDNLDPRIEARARRLYEKYCP